MKAPDRWLELCLCTAGIMGFFVFYGYLQEKLMTRPYGEDGEKFKDTAYLVFCNRMVAMSVAFGMLVYRKESLANAAPLKNFFYVSLSNFAATFCQYEALKYVSFPTQTLGKCGKMIPVLVLGSLFYKKSYNWTDYAVGVSVMIGCTLFLTTGTITSHSTGKEDTPFGLLLLIAYLFFDGFTSTFQEKLFKGYTMSTYNQMLYVNASSAILSILALLANGTLISAIAFSITYPAMLIDAILLSFCASLGQMVIYYTIKNFGALTYSTIMTTRQFVSLLLSSILFLHPISLPQWIGVAFVFAGLYYQGFMKPDKKPEPKKEEQPNPNITSPPPYAETDPSQKV